MTATLAPFQHAAAPKTVSDIDPATASRSAASGACVIVDVREPDERAREWIAGSHAMPLSKFDLNGLRALNASHLVFHCKGGKRSAEACRLASPLLGEGIGLSSLTGGMENWKASGQPVQMNTAAPRLSIVRQTQIVIGAALLASTAGAFLLSPLCLVVPAFLGTGLLFAGISGTCGLAVLLSYMPWNRVATAACAIPSSPTPATDTCCRSTR